MPRLLITEQDDGRKKRRSIDVTKNGAVGAFIHPEDERTRRQLEAIPGFSAVVKAFLRVGLERIVHGVSMAEKIRLGPDQLPDLYHRIKPVCARLDITEPEFYLEMNPAPNAYTTGDTRTFLTITSGLVEYLDSDELNAVLAHECGHIACRHVLYHTMAALLLQGSMFSAFTAPFTKPMQLALLYWQRRSELSADRAAAAALGSGGPVVETMIRLSGGPKSVTGAVNIDAYAAQADAYDEMLASTWDSLLQGMAVMNHSHPFAAVRVREIRHWAAGDKFNRLCHALAKNERQRRCPACGVFSEPTWKFCRECCAQLPERKEIL